MKVSDYLLKRQWARRATSGHKSYNGISGTPQKVQMQHPTGTYVSFSQDKFLDEIHSGAHIIYDDSYRTMRKRFRFNPAKNKLEQAGYEDVSRVAVSWQEAIRGNKTAVCGGNPPWLSNEGGQDDADKITKIKSACNVLNLNAALIELFYTIFGTGDGAICFYIEDRRIVWEVFSYENGDNCTETADYEHPEKKMGVRFFSNGENDCVEFYRDSVVELWVKYDNIEDIAKDGKLVSEDGYVLVKSDKHNLDESPFCYHREPDIPSGPAQSNIEDFEDLISNCHENIKYYAYQILFLTGGAMSLPNPEYGGKVIGSKSPDGKAEILKPADASNTLDIGFKKTYDAICDSTKSVFIKPEMLKGQNDSGAYIANLYWPEIQWAKLFYGRFHKCMTKILRVICKYVGILEGDNLGYRNLQIHYKFEPFIPKNRLEENTMIMNAVQSGFLSVETAAETSSLSNPLEIQRLSSPQTPRMQTSRDLIGFLKREAVEK